MRTKRAVVALSLALFSALPLAADEEDGDYRGALSAWASGNSDAALMMLNRLEGSAIEGGPAAERKLRAAQSEALDHIARTDSEAIVPVVLLHVAAWERDQRGNQLARLGGHRKSALAAIERFAATGTDGGTEAADASWLLVRFSQSAFAYRSAASARPWLERAIELDPQNGLAYLGLGFLEERSGHRPEAVRNYARAARARKEARLRLAVCLIRLGHATDAQPILLDVAQKNPASWMGLVAWQELGRSYFALGDYAGARRVLEQATGLHEDRRLRVMLAYALERTGDSSLARGLLAADRDALEGEQQGEETPEPRDRYNKPPNLGLDVQAGARIESWVLDLKGRLKALLEGEAAR